MKKITIKTLKYNPQFSQSIGNNRFGNFTLTKIKSKQFSNNNNTDTNPNIHKTDKPKESLLNNPKLIEIKQAFKDYIKSEQQKERAINVKKTNELSKKHDVFIPITKFDLNSDIKDIAELDENEHPCFTDFNYVKRKLEIKKNAIDFNIGDDIPIINYTEEENKTWEYIMTLIFPKIQTNGCKEVLKNFALLQNEAGLTTKKIPQLRDIDKLLQSKTGFTIVPVAGLLKPRPFLNLLAFKVFASTQFIRPLSKCEHSGEPDVVHEIIGHTSMFCDENFASFSQEIGIASLGASDQELQQLANIYWFTIEYGLVKEKDVSGESKLKVYGGAILPSIFEIDYALAMKANYYDMDFDKMQTVYYDYINLSTNYFVAESFESMKNKFIDYSQIMRKKRNWISFDYNNNKTVLI